MCALPISGIRHLMCQTAVGHWELRAEKRPVQADYCAVTAALRPLVRPLLAPLLGGLVQFDACQDPSRIRGPTFTSPPNSPRQWLPGCPISISNVT